MFFQLFSPSPFLSLLCFIFLVLVNIQSSASNSVMYQACRDLFRCRNITACYPFWGGDRQNFCGHPELQLSCENDTPRIMINDVTYHILKVDEKARVLKISRQDYLDGICSPKLLNTTIDSALFEYSTEYEALTLLYGFLSPEQLTCSKQKVNYKDGFIQTGAIGPQAFNVSVNVPVLKTLLSAAKGNLSVLGEALNQGFEVKWKVRGIELCEKCIGSNGHCGFETVSNQTICYCPNGSNSSTACSISPAPKEPPASSESSFNKRVNIAVGVAASAVGIIIILSILLVVKRKFKSDKVLLLGNKKTEKDQNIEAFVRNYGSRTPKIYNYSDVKKMTKSFSSKIGQGGYGDVYKGMLPNDRLVAVKVLKESKGNGEEFSNEVTSISKTSHVNIVTLLGFCYEGKKRALIYEYMPNGSLDKFIYDQEPSKTLSRKLEWKTMYQIAVGIARGLEYLHRGCNTKIVHFDIKPHNILLDENFCPKISDFGLAKQSQKKESIISMLNARGTVGYIAPEVFCRKFGGVSHKSDVYSYGMMILEMIRGRKNIDVIVSHTSEIDFPHWIHKSLEPGKDFEVHGVVTEEEKEIVKRMILVSLWCIQTNPSDRPSMTKVVEMLEGSLQNLQVPPKAY